MAGIDRETGKVLAGFDHLVQSLLVLFTTGIGSRIMRRLFGAATVALLGKNIVPSTFLKFAVAIHVAVALWEPRFRLVQVTFPRNRNDPDAIRHGKLGIALFGQYRPRALQGDFTPEGGERTLIL